MYLTEYLSLAISMVALLISVIAIWLSRKSHGELLYYSTIENQYNCFDKFVDLFVQNWESSHIVTLR